MTACGRHTIEKFQPPLLKPTYTSCGNMFSCTPSRSSGPPRTLSAIRSHMHFSFYLLPLTPLYVVRTPLIHPNFIQLSLGGLSPCKPLLVIRLHVNLSWSSCPNDTFLGYLVPLFRSFKLLPCSSKIVYTSLDHLNFPALLLVVVSHIHIFQSCELTCTSPDYSDPHMHFLQSSCHACASLCQLLPHTPLPRLWHMKSYTPLWFESYTPLSIVRPQTPLSIGRTHIIASVVHHFMCHFVVVQY